MLALFALIIWWGAPYFTWGDTAPLTQPEKRVYIIVFLFLIWLLKFLLIDLDAPNPAQYKDPQTRKKLQALQNRFQGAIQFLKKTTISKHGNLIRLNELPWYLLIGPAYAGKSAFLIHSGINFILQRRLQEQELAETCDWWITKDATIIDVSGKYLSAHSSIKDQQQKNPPYPMLWRFLLRLIKKQRGKNGVSGIIIALPLPEIMLQSDTKKYQAMLRDIFQRIYELQKFFNPLTCQIVITKCDLLPGFKEFFAEAGSDEMLQAWGVTLSKHNENPLDAFNQQFNLLIKRLNQQLIWRLHQERNSLARPFIKDFPLQVEQVKEFALDFVKKLAATKFPINVQGIYLTSALQPPPTDENVLLAENARVQNELQIFTEPTITSKPYFIKQFLLQGLAIAPPTEKLSPSSPSIWKRRMSIASALGVIVTVAVILGRDFQHGVTHTYSIQNQIADYQLATQQFHDPNEALAHTLKLLNALHESAKEFHFTLDLNHLLSFYSEKSQQKAIVIYHKSLQTALLPALKNYFQEYLKNPVNKNTDNIYAALKAYLMLGNPTHAQAKFILNTLQQILPKTFDATAKQQLFAHINLALTYKPSLTLNADLIDQTRKYLTALPPDKLSYIILKNVDSNNMEHEIDFAVNADNPIFSSQQVTNQIPLMFTSKIFASIFSQEITKAAGEALAGNWVLGIHPQINKNPDALESLTDQLRMTYVNNYVDVWESLLANINLIAPKDLSHIDSIIVTMISSHSPLLQFLRTVYHQTYFEPIISASPKLQSLGMLVDKNNKSGNSLYEVFIGLQTLHHYLQPIINASDKKRAAFDAVTDINQNRANPDILTQLRLIAEKNPEPVKTWLLKITDDTWRLLSKDASRYLNTAWQNEVIQAYESDIANRYPFSTNEQSEVALDKFIYFFGNPGVVANFYSRYLQTFVDTSTPEWHWKNTNNKLPFTNEPLRQIQEALLIHQMFFPNKDNKPYLQFALQPYQFSKNIKFIKLNINNKQLVDEKVQTKNMHIIAWPGLHPSTVTSIELTFTDQKTVSHDYAGNWGWFKLMDETFENAISHKEILLNLSATENPAKYLLATGSSIDPVSLLNLRHFHLNNKLLESEDNQS